MGPSFFNDGNLLIMDDQYDELAASMGPSFFNDGNNLKVKNPQRQNRSFNGAVVFQRRKRRSQITTTGVSFLASMGPSFFNDGNVIHADTIAISPQRFNGAVVFQRRKQVLQDY